MREIKFRGIRKEYDPQWHKSPFQFGHLLNYNAIGVWGNSDYYEYTDVLPETVGQFTGLHDKNGTEIWEGDICRRLEGQGSTKVISKCKVVFKDGRFAIEWITKSWFNDSLQAHFDELEIIGNIHQNPELLNT